MNATRVVLILLGALCLARSSALAETRPLAQQLRDAAGGTPVLLVDREDIAEVNARMAEEAGAARIVGRDWLVQHANRRVRKTAQRKQRFDRMVQAVRAHGCTSKTCGQATRLRNSGLFWVVTGDTADHDAAWVSSAASPTGSSCITAAMSMPASPMKSAPTASRRAGP